MAVLYWFIPNQMNTSQIAWPPPIESSHPPPWWSVRESKSHRIHVLRGGDDQATNWICEVSDKDLGHPVPITFSDHPSSSSYFLACGISGLEFLNRHLVTFVLGGIACNAMDTPLWWKCPLKVAMLSFQLQIVVSRRNKGLCCCFWP